MFTLYQRHITVHESGEINGYPSSATLFHQQSPQSTNERATSRVTLKIRKGQFAGVEKRSGPHFGFIFRSAALF
jgi:hypothetical protein